MAFDEKNKINITIIDKYGHEEKFLVDFTMTIKELKKEIYNVTNNKPNEIDLYFGKTLLNDDCSLESQNIESSNCVIEMKDKEIKVKIHGKIKIDEFEFYLILNINDTVNEMKKKINQMRGYPLEEFIIYWEYNQIGNNIPVKELNIKNNDKLEIRFKDENFDRFKYEKIDKKLIFIKFNINNKKNKNEIPLVIDKNLYIFQIKENIKKELKDQLDINCNSFELYNDIFCLNNNQTLFEIPNIKLNQTIKLNLVENPENNILYIKKSNEHNPLIIRNIKLEDKLSCLKEKINLQNKKTEFYFNNVILENNKTFNDYNIKYFDTLQLKILDIYYLKMRDKIENIFIYCSNDSDIIIFKSKIEEKTGIPIYLQQIKFIKNSFYEIMSEKKVIELNVKIYYIINIEKESFLIAIYDNQSFNDLKIKIFDNLKKLYKNFDDYDNKYVLDNLLILDNNNIEINEKNFKNFQNNIKPINLNITFKFELEIKYHSETFMKNIVAYIYIEDLKKDLANELNIPFNEIILKLNNDNYLLNNNKTFYDIIEQNLDFKYTLILERFKTLIITNGHKTELLEIEIYQKIYNLKERIKIQFNLINDFQIFLNNLQLDNENKLLDDYPEINKYDISLLYIINKQFYINNL